MHEEEDFVDINEWRDEPTQPRAVRPLAALATPRWLYPRLVHVPGAKEMRCYLCAAKGFETRLFRLEGELGMPCCPVCARVHLDMEIDLNEVYAPLRKG